MCDNRGMSNWAINNKNGLNNRSGFIAFEIIMALIVLGFIVRPVMVDSCNEWGDRTTKIEWELPMAQLLDYIGNLEGLIADSWRGIDADFGHSNGTRSPVALMKSAAQNGIVIMTAGFVDTKGNFTGDFNNNIENYQYATEGLATAFYDSAMEGMAAY